MADSNIEIIKNKLMDLAPQIYESTPSNWEFALLMFHPKIMKNGLRDVYCISSYEGESLGPVLQEYADSLNDDTVEKPDFEGNN